METSGNLDALVERVLAKAREDAASIIERGRKAAERETKRAEEESTNRRKAAEDSFKEASEHRLHSARAEAQQERRRAVMNARENAVDSIFQEALDRLQKIASSQEERSTLLRALVEEGVGVLGASSVRVRLNSNELKLAADSGFPTEINGVSVALENEPVETVGGPIISDASHRVFFENTFEARLDRMREDLRRLVSDTLQFDDKEERASS